MKLAAAIALVVVTASHSASACGVPDLGAMLADAFEETHEKIETPVVVLGLGASTEGTAYSGALGYAWGTKDDGWLFPGSTVTRVLVGVRSDGSDTSLSATYGWYDSHLLAAGLDLGAEAQVTGTQGFGPTGRLTLGIKGVALRLTGGAKVGDDKARFTGAAEVVFELTDIAGRI